MELDRLCGFRSWRSLSVMLDDDRFRKHRLLHHGLPSRKIYEIIHKKHSFREAKTHKVRTSASEHFVKVSEVLKTMYRSRYYTNRTANQESEA